VSFGFFKGCASGTQIAPSVAALLELLAQRFVERHLRPRHDSDNRGDALLPGKFDAPCAPLPALEDPEEHTARALISADTVLHVISPLPNVAVSW
jgi:hypothetical protein